MGCCNFALANVIIITGNGIIIITGNGMIRFETEVTNNIKPTGLIYT